MANTAGEKELKTDWPHEEGLTAETQKQTGRTMNLVAEQGSLVPRRKKVGIEY